MEFKIENGWDLLGAAAGGYVEIEKAKAEASKPVINQNATNNDTKATQKAAQQAPATASSFSLTPQHMMIGGGVLALLIVLLLVLKK